MYESIGFCVNCDASRVIDTHGHCINCGSESIVRNGVAKHLKELKEIQQRLNTMKVVKFERYSKEVKVNEK